MKRPWPRSFTVEGLNLERLLRRAGEEGIQLLEVRRVKGRRLSGRVMEEDAPRLTALAEQGGWRIEIGRPLGLGHFAERLRRRWPTVLLCALAMAALITATQVMWRVEIEDGGVYLADIRQFLDEQGIHAPAWKQTVDLAALRDALEWRYPRVAWFECGWRGMTLRVSVLTGVADGTPLTHAGAGDVVASRDGVVVSVVIKAGTAQVKAGDVVRAGQVLIRGEERTSEDALRPVSARGAVMARVWDSASVCMKTTEVNTRYTGREETIHQVLLLWFPLWRLPPDSFEAQDVTVRELPLGGLFLPLTYRETIRREAAFTREQRNIAALKEEAAAAAMRRLRQKIGNHDVFVDKWVEYCMIEDEELEAIAIGERVIDIALRDRGG